MTLMSRKVDYALLILAYLHLKPEGGCAREIADWFGLSRSFVANILKELCHQGFVTGHRGAKGGYALQREAADINLAELIETLDDPSRFTRWRESRTHGVDTGVHVCPIHGAIGEIHSRIRQMLRNVTLAELLQPAAPLEGLQIGLAVGVSGK